MKQKVIALCGPSGVGKGYTKNLIMSSLSDIKFAEPIVATTRPARPNDGISRLSGLTEKQFLTMVEVGMIVLPHRPFGEGTDLYGFVATSLNKENLLTEVHPSIIDEFINYFKDSDVMIYALKASEQFLLKVLKDRGDTKNVSLRIFKSKSEIAQIEKAKQKGQISEVLEVNFENRDTVQKQIVDAIKTKLIVPRLKVITKKEESNFKSSVLNTSFLGSKFSSPLVVASGELTETPEQIDKFIQAGAGAVVPRTTRLNMVRKKHPSPNLYQKHGSLLNAQWTGEDIEFWRPHFDYLQDNAHKIIMSVSGRDLNGCIKVCKELDSLNFPAIEINISCAASSGIHGQITRNIDYVSSAVKSIKDAGIRTPISIKLGHSDAIIEIANAAKEAGADAITAINTFGPVFDFTINDQGQPQRVLGIEGAKGGLSGNSIFNLALTDVAEISRQVQIPVIASGGVMSAEDAVKMIMSGASLVQLYTKLHFSGNNAPNELSKFNRSLLNYLKSHKITSLDTIRGDALCLLDLPTNLVNIIPTINKEKCKGCKLCTQICLNKAAYIENKRVKIDEEKCQGCGHCVSVCPNDTLTM